MFVDRCDSKQGPFTLMTETSNAFGERRFQSRVSIADMIDELATSSRSEVKWSRASTLQRNTQRVSAAILTQWSPNETAARIIPNQKKPYKRRLSNTSQNGSLSNIGKKSLRSLPMDSASSSIRRHPDPKGSAGLSPSPDLSPLLEWLSPSNPPRNGAVANIAARLCSQQEKPDYLTISGSTRHALIIAT